MKKVKMLLGALWGVNLSLLFTTATLTHANTLMTGSLVGGYCGWLLKFFCMMATVVIVGISTDETWVRVYPDLLWRECSPCKIGALGTLMLVIVITSLGLLLQSPDFDRLLYFGQALLFIVIPTTLILSILLGGMMKKDISAKYQS